MEHFSSFWNVYVFGKKGSIRLLLKLLEKTGNSKVEVISVQYALLFNFCTMLAPLKHNNKGRPLSPV